MKNYTVNVFEQTDGLWASEVKCNSDTLVVYGYISTQNDAYLIGEAFIDGIKLVEGE